jgi:hypothetical protein
MTALIVLIAGASSLIFTQFVRRSNAARQRRGLRPGAVFPVRPLPAIEAVPGMIGESIEAGRPLHISMGSAGIGGAETTAALASTALFYRIAERAAIGNVSPMVTMSDSSALALGYATLRRAYAARGRLERYQLRSVRWLPAGEGSLAFAAGLTIMAGNEQVASDVLTGSYGVELALVLFAAQRQRHMTVAGSDQLLGAAVAYAMADHALLGEEVFAAPSYLSASASRDEAGRRAALVVTDLLRWLLIAGLLLALVNSIRQPMLDGIGRLLAGGTP